MSINTRKHTRASVKMNQHVNDIVERLAEKLDISKSEVLKRGVALLDASVEQREMGRAIGAAEDRSDLDTEFIGIL